MSFCEKEALQSFTKDFINNKYNEIKEIMLTNDCGYVFICKKQLDCNLQLGISDIDSDEYLGIKNQKTVPNM
jgi:hypothetical protein